jgi:biopolymer transport protein ExbD
MAVSASSAASDDDMIVGINVTPLVDIVLVLLIIFIVTARLIAQQGIPMDLPAAASAGAAQTVFTVSIDADGALFANGAPVLGSRLRAMAAGLIASEPALRTVIQADGRARHARVLHVLDELRLAGITRIAFATERAPRGQSGTRAPAGGP